MLFSAKSDREYSVTRCIVMMLHLVVLDNWSHTNSLLQSFIQEYLGKMLIYYLFCRQKLLMDKVDQQRLQKRVARVREGCIQQALMLRHQFNFQGAVLGQFFSFGWGGRKDEIKICLTQMFEHLKILKRIYSKPLMI